MVLFLRDNRVSFGFENKFQVHEKFVSLLRFCKAGYSLLSVSQRLECAEPHGRRRHTFCSPISSHLITVKKGCVGTKLSEANPSFFASVYTDG